MHFTQLTLQNFLTLGAVKLELKGKGLVLVQGVNEDDSSTDSNGAGKSSIVDGLCWTLFGETAREVAADAVVSTVAKKDCMGCVEIEDRGVDWRVTRYRKHATGKNDLLVERFDGVCWRDMTRGITTDTQDFLNKHVLGCDLQVFKAAIYAGQEAMPDLPGMTDKHLKLLIEEAAGIQRIARAYDALRLTLKTAEGGLKNLIDQINRLNPSLKTARTARENLDTQHAGFEASRAANNQALLDEAIALEKMRDGKQAALDALDLPRLLKIQAALQGKFDSIRPLQDLAAGHRAEVTRCEREVAMIQARFDTFMNQARLAKQALEDISKRVGQPCGECGKTYCAHDLEDAERLQKDKLRTIAEAARAEKGKLEAAQNALEAALSALKAAEGAIPDLTDLNAKRAVLEGRLKDAEALVRTRDGIDKEIALKRATADKVLTCDNPHEAALAEARRVEAEWQGELDKAMHSRTALEADITDLKAACEVLGAGGVRAHILDTVTPYLNERTSDYLGDLSDGNLSATWNTLSKTAKGDVKEKFNIDVTGQQAQSFKALSGGEKKKVRIATALALQDLQASRAAKPIDFWMGDEIDGALDDAGLERLMVVLEKRARERGTVLVVSHSDLKDWISDVLTVTKTGGVSTVTGALAA